jgi:uncharacterized protein YaaW (UPF0174 family)
MRDRDSDQSGGKEGLWDDPRGPGRVDFPAEPTAAATEQSAQTAEGTSVKRTRLEDRAARAQEIQARAAAEETVRERGNIDRDFVENDLDLYPILARAKADELKLLATLISQKMSSSIEDGCRSPLAIASEIQLMGGNSLVNGFRGHGVCYKEIVLDVAETIGVDPQILSRTGNSVASMENDIIEKLFARFEEQMNASDREPLSRPFARASQEARIILLAQALLPHLLREFNLQGAVELALILAASRAVMAWVPVVGWLSAGVGTLLELSSTAYSVTIPCVVVIGLIRARLHEADYYLDS